MTGGALPPIRTRALLPLVSESDTYRLTPGDMVSNPGTGEPAMSMTQLPPIVGCASPWGTIERTVTLAPGIVHCTTASHGGFWLSAGRYEQVSPEGRAYAAKWAPAPWFEQDVCWAFVCMTFPEAFRPAERENAPLLVTFATERAA